MALNQLGNFLFVALHGPEDRGTPPQTLREQVEIVQRPGYDGSAVIRMGEKGVPFQMRSFVDTTSGVAAMALGKLYEEAQGGGPFGLIWGGINFFTAFDVLYVPIDVRVMKVRTLTCAVGGIYWPSRGCLEAAWTLLPITAPQAPAS